MNPTQLLPRKSPRQARAAATVAVMLEAAARVLSTGSLADFNTNRVAEVAGVSVGSLYQYFPNKEALVAALIEREHELLAFDLERCVAACAGKSLRQTMQALTLVAVDQQFGRAAYAAALDREEQRLPMEVALDAVHRRILGAVLTALQHHRNDLAVSPTMVVALDCLTIAKALVHAEATQPTPDVAGLKRRVHRALLGYLQHRPGASATSTAPTPAAATSAPRPTSRCRPRPGSRGGA